MRLKFLLGTLLGLMLWGAYFFSPRDQRALDGAKGDQIQGSRRLRLMSWNIGYGDLESETRAHAADLPAVAQVILNNDPDAVALQELTGEDQVRLLLGHLQNRYRGYVCSFGGSNRVDAVLVRDRSARFNDVPAGDRFAAAATFRLHKDLPEIVLVSAHADAFSAARRRTFSADVVDWVRSRPASEIAFIAGDFNFEVSTRNKTNLFTDDAKHDSESYAYLLKYFRDLGRDAGETSINDRRIDYIFGPPQTVSFLRADVLRGAGIGGMDHWPLLVEVAL